MNGHQERSFLGEGWAFPICAQNGAINSVALEEDIRQSILIILGTNRGERVMRPDFGAGLNTFVFEPVNETTKELIRTRVEESLIDWEPRIDVLQVRVTPDTALRGSLSNAEEMTTTARAPSADNNALLISIDYRVRATNSLSNLVYPFYLQEGAGQ